MDHYFKEGRIPRSVWHGPEQELRDWVEECYGQDTGMVLDECDYTMEDPLLPGATLEGIEDRIGELPKEIDTNPMTMNPTDTPTYIRKQMAAGKMPREPELRPSPQDVLNDLGETMYEGKELKNKSKPYSHDDMDDKNNDYDDDEKHIPDNYEHDRFGDDEENMYETSYSAKKAAAGKDIGKPGKNFEKISKDAAKRYGSKAAGERVAGAVLNKLRHPKESVEEAQEMDESALQAWIGDKTYGEKGMDELRDLGRKHVGKKKMDAAKEKLKKNPKNEDAQMEAWDKQFDSILNEGQSVSISLGQENMPDSVTVTANDQDAHELIKLLQNAGMGGVVGAAQGIANATDAEGGENTMMSVNRDGEQGEEVQVVDFDDAQGGLEGPSAQDNGDTALSFLKKMLGQKVDAPTSGEETSDDEQVVYGTGDGEDSDKEETDEGAGVMHYKKEQAEKAGEDHFELGGKEYPVKEDEMDEGAGVMHFKKEQAEKAGKDSFELGGKSYPVKEESESEEDDHAERAGKKVARDIEHDEGDDGEEDDKAERAGKKVTKDIEYDDKRDKEKVDEGEWDGTGAADMAAAVSQSANDAEAAETEKATAMAEDEETCNECGMYESKCGCSMTENKIFNRLLKMMEDKKEEDCCDDCGKPMNKCKCDHDDHKHEKLDEWANQVNSKTKEQEFDTEMEYMMNLISGGLNGKKSTGQTTIPVIAHQGERVGLKESDLMVDLRKLSGLR
jgi:hypothetical protein